MSNTIYTCDVCGKNDKWSDDWQWFGSIRDWESKGMDGIVITCSDACREKAEKVGKIVRKNKKDRS